MTLDSRYPELGEAAKLFWELNPEDLISVDQDRACNLRTLADLRTICGKV